MPTHPWPPPSERVTYTTGDPESPGPHDVHDWPDPDPEPTTNAPPAPDVSGSFWQKPDVNLGGWILLTAIALVSLALGTIIGANAGDRVDIDGHEGQVLVVETDGGHHWCAQDDHECHGTGQ